MSKRAKFYFGYLPNNTIEIFQHPAGSVPTLDTHPKMLGIVGPFKSRMEVMGRINRARISSEQSMRLGTKKNPRRVVLEIEMTVTSGQKRRALEIIKGARKALGGNIGLTDLLLDNMDELNSVSDARKIIKALGLPLVLTEGRGRFMMKNPRKIRSRGRIVGNVQGRAFISGKRSKFKGPLSARLGVKRKMRYSKSDPRKIKKALRRLGIRVNPARKILKPSRAAKQVERFLQTGSFKHHVCVQADGKTIAQMRDTPEMRTLAKRFAKTYKRKHPAAVVSVVAY